MIAWKELILIERPSSTPTITQEPLFKLWNYKDTPLVAISKSEIVYAYVGRYNSLDSVENGMMSIRWKTFKFYRQVALSEQVDLTPCPKCFADLIMEGSRVSI